MNYPLIVSYYTPRTAYEEHARELKKSAERLRLRARIEPRETRGGWLENCAQKAFFIADIRREVREPVLWVDADATLRRPVHEVADCSADFAIVKRNGWNLFAGQIYFGTGPGVDRLVDTWCDYCHDFPHIVDQLLLGYAWWDTMLAGGVSTLWLDNRVFQKVKSDPARRLCRSCSRRGRSFTSRKAAARSSRGAQNSLTRTCRSGGRWPSPARSCFRSTPNSGASSASYPTPFGDWRCSRG